MEVPTKYLQFQYIPPNPKSNTTIRVWQVSRYKLKFLANHFDVPMTDLLDSLLDQVLEQYELQPGGKGDAHAVPDSPSDY